MFQRMIDQIHRGCQDFADVYIDDVGFYSVTWEEHLSDLREVFTWSKTAELTVKLKKCQFGKKKMPLLGHIVGGGCIKPDPQKLETVRDYPQPTTKTEVRAFMDWRGAIEDFVPDYATTAAPLTSLIRKKLPDSITRNECCNQAFEILKSKLVNAPVLKTPDTSGSKRCLS